jgi:diguanylate cyclase (GGDEF)-like protein
MASKGVRASDAERRRLRLDVARKQVPEILAWAGLLTIVFGIVNYVTLPSDSASSWVVNAIFGPLFLAIAFLLRTDRLPDAAAPWSWALSSLVLVAMLVNAFRLDPTPANLAYIVAVMTAFGPLTHAWPPFIVAAVGMTASAAVGFALTPDESGWEDLLVCLAALAISAALLRLRIKALDDVADSEVQLDHQAMFDPMTDVLNRNGLTRSLPTVLGTAQRGEQSVLVWFIDVRGLKAANDVHGHRFGDAIILAVTRALKACVRTNDLVSRWGGDEFVVVGEGVAGSAEDLNERVNRALAADPDLAGRWAGTVTMGFASGPPDADVDALISAADADMYRRRLLKP